MAKAKKKSFKKRNLSDLHKNVNKKSMNPFEIHVNRQKYNVIGRKLKNDKGLPGISRSKAMKKRKATILQEYKIKDKSNQFFDRRIGERNSSMTAEDRVIARFTKERMKRHSKKNMFNLDDDEVLTHHGQTLSEIEKFDNPASDDEYEEERGKLEADFVEEAHFGGGMLAKANGEKPSRKDLIEQLIAESKKRKAEKQQAREQTLVLTEKLDSEWKDLLPIVSASKKKDSDGYHEDSKPDSYDTVMRELKFEARGKPSEPLKSEETLAKEEEERLGKLEDERLQRMSGFSEKQNSVAKHRSADDLDDGFMIESDVEEPIIYDAEGHLINQKDDVNDSKQDGSEGSQEGDSEEMSEEEEEEEEEEEMSEGENVGRSSAAEEEGGGDEKKGVEDAEENSIAQEESASDEEAEDNLSDLKHLTESETEEEDDESADKLPDKERTVFNSSNGFLDEKGKKAFIERVKRLFPQVSEVPDQYESLQTILDSYSTAEQGIIIEHIMRSNHSGLNEKNKQKLETLFAYMLQYLHDAPVPTKEADSSRHCFSVLNALAPHLYDLAHMNPVNAWRSVIEVLKEKHDKFNKRSRRYPKLDTLVFLKVVSLLFPTSDFRHPVVTPTLVFMCQMLLQCRVRRKRDVASGLLLVALILEFSVLSKRFCPSAINFLRGVLYSAVPKSSSSLSPPVPPFKKSGEVASLLALADDKMVPEVTCQVMELTDLTDDSPIDDSFRTRALFNAVAMLKEFHENLEGLAACGEIFKPVCVLLTELELVKSYPSVLREEIQNLRAAINKTREKKLQLLVVEKTRAKALRLYEPHVEKIFDGKRKRPMGREKQEHEKLLHKYKREQKAALREIRRDNSFISKLKWKDTLRSDMERNEKVKEIFGAAANQQGELRKLKRMK